MNIFVPGSLIKPSLSVSEIKFKFYDITNTCFSAALDKAERLGEGSPVGRKTTLCMLLTWGPANDREDTEGKRDDKLKIFS